MNMKYITRKQNIILFGKYKGRKVTSLPLSYLDWMMREMYNKMDRQEQNVLDFVATFKLEKLLKKPASKLTQQELDYLKQFNQRLNE